MLEKLRIQGRCTVRRLSFGQVLIFPEITDGIFRQPSRFPTERDWSIDGIKVLGTPLGGTKFVSSIMEERVKEEQRLWEAIPFVLDLQCAWQILLQERRSTRKLFPPNNAAQCVREVRSRTCQLSKRFSTRSQVLSKS